MLKNMDRCQILLLPINVEFIKPFLGVLFYRAIDLIRTLSIVGF
jgi:hypothetical protein